MICLLLSNDLMFGSQVRVAVQRVGGNLTTVTSIDELEQAATRVEGSYMVLIDLGLAGILVADVVTRLRAQSEVPQSIVAVGAHVHAEKLSAAKNAGCDYVLSKGQASRELADLLATLNETP